MIVYRICRSVFANDLSGRGAEQAGGRWNSKGIPMLYTGESKAVCIAEMSLRVNLALLPDDYKMVTIEIPDDIAIPEKKNTNLPRKWNAYPFSSATQEVGDKFIKEKDCLAMKVPSAIAQEGFNVLINPNHKDFSKVKITLVEPLFP
jgi:RES domain-containing protein